MLSLKDQLKTTLWIDLGEILERKAASELWFSSNDIQVTCFIKVRSLLSNDIWDGFLKIFTGDVQNIIVICSIDIIVLSNNLGCIHGGANEWQSLDPCALELHHLNKNYDATIALSIVLATVAILTVWSKKSFKVLRWENIHLNILYNEFVELLPNAYLPLVSLSDFVKLCQKHTLGEVRK